ncbi:hypothetical protein ACFL2B_00875 [Patescibacteria group bacterium]
MVVEAKRKEKESIEGLIRRFNKKLQQSGNIYKAREVRFHQKHKSKAIQREEATRRQKIFKSREHLKKLGMFGMHKFRRSQQRLFQMRRPQALKEKHAQDKASTNDTSSDTKKEK